MDFQITLAGLNHRTASVDVRERFALGHLCAPDNWAIPKSPPLSEVLILSTCNRVELLAVGEPNSAPALLERWARACGASVGQMEPYLYTYHDLEAVSHVFEVAASLDSMVLGEPQILGQMKQAYRKAVEAKNAGMILNSLMHKAFSVAKRVRSETAVASSAVSISYAAVELARRIFGHMDNHRALLIGAGEMAELAAAHLLHAGMEEIIVINRTMSRGEELAKRFQGRAESFDNLVKTLEDVDMVIASTGSPEPIITAETISQALKARKNRPMFLIDIAVPRDIAADVNNLDNVYLYDIDDLKEVVEENRQAREAEAQAAKRIITEEVQNFSLWLENLSLKPTILELMARGEQMANAEVERIARKFGPMSDETKAALEALANGLVKKFNHAPLSYLKADGMGRTTPHERIAAVRRVFNLDKS